MTFRVFYTERTYKNFASPRVEPNTFVSHHVQYEIEPTTLCITLPPRETWGPLQPFDIGFNQVPIPPNSLNTRSREWQTICLCTDLSVRLSSVGDRWRGWFQSKSWRRTWYRYRMEEWHGTEIRTVGGRRRCNDGIGICFSLKLRTQKILEVKETSHLTVVTKSNSQFGRGLSI